MSEHTKGKLHQAGLEHKDTHWMREIRDSENSGIAFCGGYAGKAHADARRLTACWNACEGIPTKDLEELPEHGFYHLAVNTDKLASDYDSLRAVNAELLEALEACHYTLTNPQIGQWSYMEGSEIYADFSEAADKARAAIAKANALKGTS